MTAIPDIMLNNGRTIPQFGFGVFQVKPAVTGSAPSTGSPSRRRRRSRRGWSSVTPALIKENIDIFDFELSGEDVEAITALNRDERTGPDPDKFAYLPS
jgi:diketogulonate reductase-like aldo/keto reductase